MTQLNQWLKELHERHGEWLYPKEDVIVDFVKEQREAAVREFVEKVKGKIVELRTECYNGSKRNSAFAQFYVQGLDDVDQELSNYNEKTICVSVHQT